MKKLLYSIIGLVRAMENNEELVTDNTAALVINGYSLYGECNEKALTDLLFAIREEKKRLVPLCFECTSPCGRTDDCAPSQLFGADTDVCRIKKEIITSLCAISRKIKDTSPDKSVMDAIYRATFTLGIDYWERDKYESILRELNGIAKSISL